METFERAGLQRFTDQMVDHLHGFAPKQVQMIEEKEIREIVTVGINRADRYGLTKRSPVRLYIELMFMFGSDFDTDPQLTWAREILTNVQISHQTERAARLYDGTIAYVDAVAGPDNSYEVSALRRICEHHSELADFRITESSAMIEKMRLIHPEKCNSVGESGLQALISCGNEITEDFAVTAPEGVMVFSGLMFIFGHGCASDPLFPWIRRTMTDESIEDSNRRLERLFSRTMTYLNRALQDLEMG